MVDRGPNTLPPPPDGEPVQPVVVSQETMDKIEHMMEHYAQMMQGLCLAGLRLPPGPQKGEFIKQLECIEKGLLDVAEALFPEKHAAALQAKRSVLGQINGWLGRN